MVVVMPVKDKHATNNWIIEDGSRALDDDDEQGYSHSNPNSSKAMLSITGSKHSIFEQAYMPTRVSKVTLPPGAPVTFVSFLYPANSPLFWLAFFCFFVGERRMQVCVMDGVSA